MSYIDGFVVPVPAGNKDAYLRMAEQAMPLFKEYGAARVVECWSDDVPDGKVTDFKGAVNLETGEVVVYSWIEWPSKAARDGGQKKMMEDPRMKNIEGMPFNGQRMIYGGFAPIVEETKNSAMGYVDGSLLAVPTGNRDAYRAAVAKSAAVFMDHGATRVIDAWGDDVPDGKVTDFRRAVKATPDETVVFGWIEWPSKDARDAAWPKVMTDPRMAPPGTSPFDGQRMVFGGFAPILDA